jgi:hypothetical protein
MAEGAGCRTTLQIADLEEFKRRLLKMLTE